MKLRFHRNSVRFRPEQVPLKQQIIDLFPQPIADG
jgi:hypothetical protein